MTSSTGDDIYVVNEASDLVDERLNGVDQGGTDLVRAYISYSLGADIENLILGASDDINGSGNSKANVLRGNIGDNVLDGGRGDDRLLGAAGHDELLGGDGNDRLYGGEGDDLLRGQANDDHLFGEDGNDILEGGAGNDRLEGGRGNDTMRGGGGDDEYIVESRDDLVIELIASGYDTVRTSVSYDLGASSHVELLQTVNENTGFAMDLTGSNINNTLRGNQGNNTLTGLSGDDRLHGLGGDDRLLGGDGKDTLYGDAGDDTLNGGAGDDLLWAGDGDDVVIGGSGADSVYGGAGGDRIEGGAGDDVLRGEQGADQLYGGAGNDKLYSGATQGGLGETLDGGQGDDTFYVDSANAVIIERAGEGIDTVRTTVNVFLAHDADVEFLRVANSATTNTLRLVGSNTNNELRGNAGDNVLNGRGGADRMLGFEGNDVYHVDDINDVVIEYDGNGFDTLVASINIVLGTSHSIEVLQASTTQTAAVLSLTGNARAQFINGNAQANILSGRGGDDVINAGAGNDTLHGDDGNDRLIGGLGDDTFYGWSGSDTAVLATTRAGATIRETTTALIITSADGVDRIDNSVEWIAFNDGVLSYAQVAALASSSDTLRGTTANDWLVDSIGTQTIDGGTGVDTVSFVYQESRVNVSLSTGIAASDDETKTLRNIENVTGSIHGDYIVGDGQDNRIRGLGDYDWIVGSDGADIIDGGNGRDMVSYVNATSAIKADLSAGRGLLGQAEGDRYVSVEGITGSRFDDHVTGSDEKDVLRGMAGNDWFVGSDGGRDRYDGGAGQDTLAYSNASSAINASLLLGRGFKEGFGRDSYVDIENLSGSRFDDRLSGDHGRNVLKGKAGDDRLFGNGGADDLEGGAGNDMLDGGLGHDKAYFSGQRSEYQVTTAQNGSILVNHLLENGDGFDSLTDIETLVFADQTLTI